MRGAVVDKPEAAYWHARDIIDFQRTLGFFWEDDMNRWVADKKLIAQVLNYVYFYLHFPLIIVFGMWLYYFRRGQYTFVRMRGWSPSWPPPWPMSRGRSRGSAPRSTG